MKIKIYQAMSLSPHYSTLRYLNDKYWFDKCTLFHFDINILKFRFSFFRFGEYL